MSEQGFCFAIPRRLCGGEVHSEEMLRKMGLNDRQIKAVKYLKERGKITNRFRGLPLT
jgi:hypothetical protein